MRETYIILKKELLGYFATPVAYVFLIIFLMLIGVFTFEIGHLYAREQADLSPFFYFHPWLYLILMPALTMRLWAEERQAGTIELLMTLPISNFSLVLGKFLAAWLFTALALVFTVPVWLTVNYLGQPDNGVIFASYLGSWLMAGAFIAVGICMSAFTKNQIISFIIAVVVCFVFMMMGLPLVLNALIDWLPTFIVSIIAQMSFLTHFSAISKGVLDLRDVAFFLGFIVAWLFATAVVINLKKAD